MDASALFADPGASAELLLPQLNWQQFARQAKSVITYRALVSSGVLFAIGLAWRSLQQVLLVQQGRKASWAVPIAHLVVIVAVLTQYQRIVPQALAILLRLGDIDGQQDALFVSGLEWMKQALTLSSVKPLWDGTNVNSALFEYMLIDFVGKCLHLALSATVLGLRALQIFFLATFVQIGPLVLGCSYLGGPLAGLARGWAFAIVEVASWSWILHILAATFGQSLGELAGKPASLPRNIVVSLATIAMVLSVPFLANMLCRGARTSIRSALAAGHESRLLWSRPSGAESKL